MTEQTIMKAPGFEIPIVLLWEPVFWLLLSFIILLAWVWTKK